MHFKLTLVLVFFIFQFSFTQALPRPFHEPTKQSFSLPIRRKQVSTGSHDRTRRRGIYSGSTGLGDFLDLFYSVPITVGGIEMSVNLDTGSSDFWVITDDCKSELCTNANSSAPYPASKIQSPVAGQPVEVDLQYGDSLTGTHAAGPVAMDTSVIASLSMQNQMFGAVSDTNNTSVGSGASGIIGLGFPSESFIQAAVVNAKFNNPQTTDDFVSSTATDGPLLSRLSMSGYLEQPMFTVMLQRDIIDVSGTNGEVTVGRLPDGVDNSSLTWVPVRLYQPADGGLNPPSFSPNEVYPLRWEVPLDGVYLDGKRLDSGKNGVSALLDTGNSILRGPANIVNSVLSSVSSAFSADHNAAPTYPCAQAHTLAFQFGGNMFPVDPRDFVSQNQPGDATACVANNIVSTDPPSFGALFSWSLGDPFFKSNLIAFYYGNLTHPSVDPPRIGFMSLVPTNASVDLEISVSSAVADGGNFESTSQAVPTATSTELAIPSSTVTIPLPDTTSALSFSVAVPSVTSTSASRTSASRGLRADVVFLLFAGLWTLSVL